MTYLDDLANDYQNTPGTVDLVHVAGGAETTRFGADLRVFQIVWPDGQGRYPSDPLYDAAGCPQQALWEAG